MIIPQNSPAFCRSALLESIICNLNHGIWIMNWGVNRSPLRAKVLRSDTNERIIFNSHCTRPAAENCPATIRSADLLKSVALNRKRGRLMQPRSLMINFQNRAYWEWEEAIELDFIHSALWTSDNWAFSWVANISYKMWADYLKTASPVHDWRNSVFNFKVRVLNDKRRHSILNIDITSLGACLIMWESAIEDPPL